MENTKRYTQEPHVERPVAPVITIHWLTFVLPFKDPAKAMEVLGIDHGSFYSDTRFRPDQERTWFGYYHRYESRYGCIYFDPRGKRPILVEMSGKECEEYEARLGAEAWTILITRVVTLDGVWKRIDIPIDDRSGLVTLGRVRRHLEGKAIRTRLRSKRLYGDLETGAVTYVIGSDQSELYVRFYDKRLEVQSK